MVGEIVGPWRPWAATAALRIVRSWKRANNVASAVKYLYHTQRSIELDAAESKTCPDGKTTVYDRLEDGHWFRTLNVVDVFTRECLAIHADRKLSGAVVAKVLDGIGRERGLPEQITVDNGTEFFSQAMDRWAYAAGVRLDFIRPGRPTENAFIESFNGKLRDECLNAELFSDLLDARRKLAAWRREYNEERPHSSIGNLTPVEFANQVRAVARTAKANSST